MSDIKKYIEPIKTDFTQIDNTLPDFADMQMLPAIPKNSLKYRFYRVDEISEGKAAQYRLAMANVISNLSTNNQAMVYLLSGTPEGITLYLGVAGEYKNDAQANDEAEVFESAFNGNFLGAKLSRLPSDSPDLMNLEQLFSHPGNKVGLISGVPSYNEEEADLDGKDFQGIERLANSLIGDTWQMVIVAEPASDEDINTALNDVYDLATQLSSHIKHSVQQSENSGWNTSTTIGKSANSTTGSNTGKSRSTGKSTSSSTGKSNSGSSSSSSSNKGTSESTNITNTSGESQSYTKGTNDSSTDGKSGGNSLALTRERTDKRNEQTHAHLNDTQIGRFLSGRSKGMFRTAVYVCGRNSNTFSRLSRSVLAIFQGSKPSYTPLTIHELKFDGTPSLSDLLQVRRIHAPSFIKHRHATSVVHSVPQYDEQHIAGGTWLNTQELSLIAGLPTLELPGLKVRKSVSFALNTVDVGNTEATVKLGKIRQDGRILENKIIEIPHDALNKHVFVTGVTGAGKTTTCMKLLLDCGFPFAVIEPAKTEYRALHGQLKNEEIEYYALGREDLCTFRLNPFELVSARHNLTGHISMLKATMCAVFPMEASMPFIVEQAIIQAYQAKGWDIANSRHYWIENPWQTAESVWPTFTDMIEHLEGVIKSAGMGKEFEEKYQGSLVSRLSSLTKGIKGSMINTPRSIDFGKLLDKKVVIELEELKDEEDKAFFMGLIINRFAECMKQRHHQYPEFKHITLIEEAHRLLSQSEPGADGSKKQGVETFANLLAEVRKYGECLVIADQIPNKLVSDVIKNTNTKIVHRLFAADDRRTIGDAMSLNDEQKDFLPMLQAGETIVYSGGWHASVRAQIDQLADTTAPEISEAAIQQQGRKQLYVNRNELLPTLSRRQKLNENNFAEIFQTLRRQLNMLVQFAQWSAAEKTGNSHKNTDYTLLKQSIAQALSQSLQTGLHQHSCSIPEWAGMLSDLFTDATSKSFSNAELQSLKAAMLFYLDQLAVSGEQFIKEIFDKKPYGEEHENQRNANVTLIKTLSNACAV